MPTKPLEKVKVNEVVVDFVALKVCIKGQWQHIEARQLSLLKLLLENHGSAVSRNQIMDTLWHDTIVSDNSVSQAVTQLRKSLHDDKETPRFIRTVPRVGYQLIAEVEYPAAPVAELPATVPTIYPTTALAHPPARQSAKMTIAISSAVVSILFTLLLLEWLKPGLAVPIYQYESRLTSVPGPENFLRYSPDGRYLAFNQTSENRSHMDLVVYDSQNQSIHSIKSTGYSEQAPEWSADGRWLIYYRHDPISCDIRIMSVINPVETWRLSPDFHLSDCEPGYSRQKMHWLNAETLYLTSWLDNRPVLTKISLSDDKLPMVIDIQHYPKLNPVLMDLDKTTSKLLLVEKHQPWYQLKLLDLNTFKTRLIEQSKQDYWGLKWHDSEQSFWLGNESLRLMSLDGDSKIVHLPMGFIPDIDLNPVTQQLAHAEGLVNVNLYSMELNNNVDDPVSRRLSSSARTDILPAIANDGSQTAFISYQRRSMDGLKHVEIWLKHQHKKAASLLTNLAESNLAQSMVPDYLLWSPNGENILLGDSAQNLYLINTFSRHMVPIVSGYEVVDEVNWSADGKQISFKARQGQDQWQHWRYDLQLATTQPVKNTRSSSEPLNAEQIRHINPSYSQYQQHIADFLTRVLAEDLPVDNLQPSFALYRPAVIDSGIYYIVRQGHQLKLFFYHFDRNDNRYITDVGNHEQDINVQLNLSASQDGRQLVFSKVEGIETDILVQRAAGSN